MKKQRKVWASAELRDLVNAFWRPRTEYTSAGDVARIIVEDIAANGIVEEQLADHDMPGRLSIRVRVEDEVWEGAIAKASEAGISINSAVRRRLLNLMGHTNDRTEDS